MASKTSIPCSGRVARVVHWLFPFRRQVAIGLVTEVTLAILGIPLWLHLALGVLLHIAVHLLEPGLR